MKPYTRTLILVLAAVALAASLASLYVHYRLITDPTYSSFCDISETVSCQQVFQSEYGSVFGVPVAAGGAIWSALVLLLAFGGLRHRASELAGRVAGYIFALATLGLAAVFYFAYASWFVLGQTCPLCATMYVAIVGIFLVSANAAGSLTALPGRLGQDLTALRRSTTGSTLAGAWLAASLALVVLFPTEEMASAQETASAPEAVVPLETLTPEQITEWEQWLDAQPREAEAAPTGTTAVRLVKFNDYQCPACRQTWSLYRGIIDKYEKSHAGLFSFENRDFPLESECGLGGVHGAACEAAAAVRMAKEKNRHRELEAVLFERQSASMSRDDVKAALREVAQIDDFDARYAEVLEAVRADAQLGQKLGVTGTPTFFLNGVRLPTVRPAYLDAAIAYELKKAEDRQVTAGD